MKLQNTYYFPHDINARNDEKIVKLQNKLGLEAVCIYWYLIEMLYESNGYLELDYELLTFNLRLESERIAIVKRVINEFDLFKIASKKFTNRRVIDTLKFRKTKSEKARNSAKIKWKKHYANAEQTQSERYARKGKERKGKESKVNTIAETSSAPLNLLKDKNKHIQIIGLYAKCKNIVWDNKQQQQSFIKRNLRPASDLKGYDQQRIIDILKYLKDNADFKWTLETVGKYIDEDLTKINKQLSENEIIDNLLKK